MGTLGRSTAVADGCSGGSGSGSGPARFEAGDDSGGSRVGSGGELVRSFVELVKTVEAKVSVGMSFGDMDTCMSRLRGSESVGELESGLGEERRVVSIGSKTNSDANEDNGNCCDETKTNGVGVEENGKCLDEIVEELDGEIEVPIAGTSENGEDRVGEELSDGVNEFCIGDFVWGKIKNHPWWPGQICDPSDASDLAAKLRSKDKLLVAYFGDDTFAWCHPSQLKPFEENFVENSKLSSSKVFVIAVQQAVDEIGRLVKLKMSCACMGEEFLSGRKQTLASNAGVKEGVVVPEGRVGKFLGHLSQPVDLLAELKHMAQAVSLTSVLELNVLKSLLSAFYCSKGGYQLPVYIEPQLIPGLEDERKMVEVPVQWPSDDRSSSPIGSNTGNTEQNLLQRSPPSIENRQPHKRKEKTIADLLGEANHVEVKSMDGVVAKESAISDKRGLSSRRKKQKSSDIHGEGILTFESGRERAKLSKSPTSTKDEGIGIESSDGLAKESAGGNEETKKTPLSRKRKRDEDSIDSKDGDTQEKRGGKDETKKAPLSRRRKKNEDIHINSNDGEAKGKAGARVGELLNVGLQTDMKDQIGKSPLLRERKKSKYLSPPFTISDAGKRKRNLETESRNAVTSHDLGKEGKERDMESVLSLEVSSKAQLGDRITRAAANIKGSPQILNSCSEALQEKLSIEGGNKSTDVKTPAEGEKKRVDPIKANAATNEVLSGVRSAALDPLYPVKRKSSFEIVVDFVSIFRDSVYHNGCYHKLYKKHQPHGKRKKSDSEPGSLVKDNQTAANLREGEPGNRVIKKKQDMKSDKPTKKQAGETRSSKRRKLNSVIKSLGKDNEKAENQPVSESGQRNINTNQDKPKKKQAAEPPISKLVRRRSKHADARDLKIKETEEEAPPTFLFVTFGPGSSLPTKDDLLRLYSKFGELNETETEMFYTNFCARVAFVMSSDAEEAFNYSLIDSPFGASNVNFRLQNPSGASKTRELSAIPESPPAKKKSRSKTASEALVASQPPAGEPSQVDFIRHRLKMMSSMLGNSDRKVSPVATSKIQNEIKELLKVVSTMGESSS
ncbi:PWWP domain-containing protein 3-like [Rosa rugosa]|uniref:PWWP domain-containing protein 3-like n=1 Tax=Rosa rugosa TaxID=74645 RepID=UPI002B4017DA|nr:PWWP domain-containing protein 3-like [Rosa rugosa]